MGKCTLTIHTLLSVAYCYSTYAYIYDIHPPDDIQMARTSNYGPFKYLTFWNLLIQCAFFALSALNDLTSSGRPMRMGRSALHRMLDFLFATVVFSCAVFVTTSFWSLYNIDRNLIFPEVFDTFFPTWLNHAIHSMPAAAVLLEMFAVNHNFPTQRKGFLTVAAFTLIYLGWVCHIANSTGHWVYPILAQLSPVGRGGFIAGMAVLVGVFYIVGHGLQALRWGHEESYQDLIYHKRK